MVNIYWPVYKNLERQFTELMFNIHIDDNQLTVYSSKISDLILRAAVEIESLAKDLYSSNGGTKSTSHIKYDEEAIKYLNQLWLLEKKVVIISSPNCFLSNNLLYPFVKNELRTGKQTITFGWNNAYQNIKHDRVNGLKLGSIKYLFDIMAALYVLNVYYKDETFNLGRDSSATSFPFNLGSEIFSISLHKWGYSNSAYIKQANFDECIYLTKMTDKTREDTDKIEKERWNKEVELYKQHPKIIRYTSEGDTDKYKQDNGYRLDLLAYDVLGLEEYKKIQLQAAVSVNIGKVYDNQKYEVILNKNNIA